MRETQRERERHKERQGERGRERNIKRDINRERETERERERARERVCMPHAQRSNLVHRKDCFSLLPENTMLVPDQLWRWEQQAEVFLLVLFLRRHRILKNGNNYH